MNLNNYIANENHIESSYKKSFIRTINIMLFFIMLSLVMMGYHRKYHVFNDVYIFIIDLLRPLITAMSGEDRFIEIANSIEAQLIFHTFVQLTVVLVPFLIFLKFRDKNQIYKPEKNGIFTKKPFFVIAFALGIGYMASILGNLVFTWVPAPDNGIGYDSNTFILILEYVQIAIVPAIIEEIAFRKIMITSLAGYNKYFAVIFTATAFGLLHGNPAQSFFAFVIGLVYGFVYLSTGSIKFCILLHFLNNSLSFIIQKTVVENLIDIITPQLIISSLFMYTMIGLAITYISIYAKRKNHRRNPLYLEPRMRVNPQLSGGYLLNATCLNLFFPACVAIYFIFTYLTLWQPNI